MGNAIQQAKSEETKEKILFAINELTKNKSISEVTIREVCKKAELSIGAFYHHFPSKEAAILYVYRRADIIFSELDLGEHAHDNIRIVFKKYLNLLHDENLNTLKSIYISHLSYYDDYFFSEERPLFVILYQQVDAITDKRRPEEEVKSLVWMMLNFCRGILYNMCIQKSPDLKNWPDEALERTMDYFYFIVEKSY